MLNPLVSIIIPLYNSEKYISETIHSALNQTYQNIEIIIVDDGSTDNSLKIAKSFESKKVRIYTQQNKGASAARNYGIREAKGEYIQFLDADDLLSDDKVEKQVSILIKNRNCLIGCRWIRFRANISGVFEREGPHESIRKNLSPLEWLLIKHTILVHCWLTPKILIDKAGAWNENMSYDDDGEYFSRIIYNSENVLYTNETIVYYRSENHSSISSLKSRKKYESLYLSALTYKAVVQELSNNSIYAKIAIGNFLKKAVFEMYPKYNSLRKKFNTHDEIKYSNLKFTGSGSSGKLSKIIGWKFTKIIKFLISTD